MGASRPLEDVVHELRASGHALSPDKLQRLRVFGIGSKREGRRYYLNAETIQRLSYLLNVEATFSLARNHNALALELAYRGYPVLPWKRVHTGAQNEVRHFFNMIDRMFQRITGRKKSALTDQRIVKLSRQVARHLIPDARLDEKLSSGLGRELLERALEIILCAAYLDQDVRQGDVESILIDTKLTHEDARKVAALFGPLFNKLRPTLRMKDNAFLRAIRGPTTVTMVKATIDAMRQLRRLAQMMNTALTISSDPTVEDYPNFSKPQSGSPRITVTGHAFYYACARWVLNSDEGVANLGRLATGERQITDVLANLSFISSAIPKTIGMQYEK